MLNGAVAVLCFVTATLLQILRHEPTITRFPFTGRQPRPGEVPARAVPSSGRLHAAAMKRAVILLLPSHMLSGLAPVWLAFVVNPVAFANGWWLLIIFLGLGGLAVAPAVTYTAGFRLMAMPAWATWPSSSLWLVWRWLAATTCTRMFCLDNFLLPPAAACLPWAYSRQQYSRHQLWTARAAGTVRLGLRRRLYLQHWRCWAGLFSATLRHPLHLPHPWQWLFLLAVPPVP